MDHLLHCANKLFGANEHKRPDSPLSVSMKPSERAPDFETNTRESQTGMSCSPMTATFLFLVFSTFKADCANYEHFVDFLYQFMQIYILGKNGFLIVKAVNFVNYLIFIDKKVRHLHVKHSGSTSD